MTRVDAVAGDPGAGDRDVGLALAVEALAGLDPRRQQAVLLELAREVGRDTRPLAELGQVDLLLRSRGCRRSPSGSVRAGQLQLLADHAQRQELVALQPEDRLEPLDVGVREQPVAAARAARREQPLILEVADLRDRDVRELVPQALADRADRVQARGPGCSVRRHRCRNVIRYLPTWTSSSSSSSADSMRRRLTNVPLRLPRSRIVNTVGVAEDLGVPARHRDVVEEHVAVG